jgi:hypothetical protein
LSIPWWWPWRLLSPGQKMDSTQSSQISVKIYYPTWCHILKDNIFQLTNLSCNRFESCEFIRELCTYNTKSVLPQYCRMLLNPCLILSKCYVHISHYMYQSHTKIRKLVCFILTQNSITNYVDLRSLVEALCELEVAHSVHASQNTVYWSEKLDHWQWQQIGREQCSNI